MPLLKTELAEVCFLGLLTYYKSDFLASLAAVVLMLHNLKI